MNNTITIFGIESEYVKTQDAGGREIFDVKWRIAKGATPLNTSYMVKALIHEALDHEKLHPTRKGKYVAEVVALVYAPCPSYWTEEERENEGREHLSFDEFGGGDTFQEAVSDAEAEIINQIKDFINVLVSFVAMK